MMNDYNTQRPTLVLREYGRNIQKLVEYVKSIEDKEQRNSYASTLIDLMRQINPTVKDNEENNQKLWDDLFIMADFDIEVNSPFPIPERDILYKKPEKLIYKSGEIRFKHYGRNIELLIKNTIEIEDPKERETAIIYIGRLMKSFHYIWNRENIEDDVIIENIKNLSNGQLTLDPQKVKEEKSFEMTFHDRGSGGRGGRDKRNRNFQNRRRKN